MTPTPKPVRAEIQRIDGEIDAVVAELRSLERVRSTPHSYQRAWDKHPDLHAKFQDLYHQRGKAQIERDDLETPRRVRAIRAPRAPKCPTCGAYNFNAPAASVQS